MFQETVEPKQGKMGYFMFLIVCILVLVVAEVALVAVREIIEEAGYIMQSVFVVGIIFFCIWYYKCKLLSMRYTYFTQNTELGKLLPIPEGFSEFETGSLLVESTVGGTGSYIAIIHKAEIEGIYENYTETTNEKRIKLSAFTSAQQKKYTLLFTQENKKYKLIFQPSAQLVSEIEKSINK